MRPIAAISSVPKDDPSCPGQPVLPAEGAERLRQRQRRDPRHRRRDGLRGPGRAAGRASWSTNKPDLVGLQEVALWRSGTVREPAVARASSTPNATHVDYDFLQILLDDARRPGRRVQGAAASTSSSDVEGPAYEGQLRLADERARRAADDARRDPGAQGQHARSTSRTAPRGQVHDEHAADLGRGQDDRVQARLPVGRHDGSATRSSGSSTPTSRRSAPTSPTRRRSRCSTTARRLQGHDDHRLRLQLRPGQRHHQDRHR